MIKPAFSALLARSLFGSRTGAEGSKGVGIERPVFGSMDVENLFQESVFLGKK